MKRLFLSILIFSAALDASAQELQFSQSLTLGTVINTDDEELVPMLSPDGQTLYFSRAFHSGNTGGKYAGTDIWISRKDANGNWTPAVNAGKPWNTKRSNAVIGVSADGATVYLTNVYSNKSGISFSRLVLGKWTKPEFIAVPGINRDDLVGIYVHPAFDVILISMKGKDSFGEEDLYISLKDSSGSWGQPRTLGSSINTSGFEISPFLSHDKKRLYFSSNGHSGFGEADIFYSDRLYDSWQTWTVPRNLGNKINSEKFDAYFSIARDSICFFSSNRESTSADIFVSTLILTNHLANQQSEVNRLLDESKSLLTEIKEGTDKWSSVADAELVWFNDGALSSESKHVLERVSSRMKQNPNVRATVLGTLKSGFENSTSLYARLVKAGLISKGIEDNRLLLTTLPESIDKDELKSHLMSLKNNELLIVFHE